MNLKYYHNTIGRSFFNNQIYPTKTPPRTHTTLYNKLITGCSKFLFNTAVSIHFITEKDYKLI